MTEPPQRILHAVCTDEFAGVEQFIVRLALAQARAGHHVSVAGGDPTRMRPELAAAGISFAPVSSVAAVARVIRASRQDVDVINSHMTAADAAGVVAFARGIDRPALVSTRHFAKRRGTLAPLDPLLGPHIDAEISISAFVARAIGVPSTIVHPGIEPRAPVAFESRERVVLMAQRLQPEKQSLLGIHAFGASGLADVGWTLEIAGDGPDRAAAADLAGNLGIGSSVRFLGLRDDVEQLMARASILLATCPIEGFGLTVLEAMASGLPVVAPDAGGPAEMLAHVDRATLFPTDDSNVAATILRRLAGEPGRLRAIGDAVRERQQTRFSLTRQVNATAKVYIRAIASVRA